MQKQELYANCQWEWFSYANGYNNRGAIFELELSFSGFYIKSFVKIWTISLFIRHVHSYSFMGL